MARHILLADDSTTLHRIVKDILEQENVEVRCVENGEEALRAILKSPPGLILADLNMPRMGGFELCELLRREPHFQDIPVIFLVGPFDEYNEETAERVGGSGHLIKPFDSYRLMAMINQFLPPELEEVAALEPADDLEEVSAAHVEFDEPESEAGALDPPDAEADVDALADLPEPESLVGGIEPEALPDGWVSLELSESERDYSDESGEIVADENAISQLDEEYVVPGVSDLRTRLESEVSGEVRSQLETMGGDRFIEQLIRKVIREEVSRILPEIVESVVRSRIQELELELEAHHQSNNSEGGRGER